jgi:hypothetical protein
MSPLLGLLSTNTAAGATCTAAFVPPVIAQGYLDRLYLLCLLVLGNTCSCCHE